MRVILALSLLTALLATSAEADYFDGNSLNQLFKSEQGVDQAMARGYVAGVQDTHNGRLFCVNPNVKLNQSAAVVEKYLRDHPEDWHWAAHSLVSRAIAQAFPCKAR